VSRHKHSTFQLQRDGSLDRMTKPKSRARPADAVTLSPRSETPTSPLSPAVGSQGAMSSSVEGSTATLNVALETTARVSENETKAYETKHRMVGRAVLIWCVVAITFASFARVPTLVTEKLPAVGGVELKGEGFPAGSYAVVLGPFIIVALAQWSYRKFTRCLGLRQALTASCGCLRSRPVEEQLVLPLLGSPAMLRQSRIARCETLLALFVGGMVPLVCQGMLLWDYSYQFHFVNELFNHPSGLWFHWAKGVLRPTTFNGGASSYHPSLLVPWQPWLYLALLVWSLILVCDMYRLLAKAWIRDTSSGD
jgi:hypothetical protein